MLFILVLFVLFCVWWVCMYVSCACAWYRAVGMLLVRIGAVCWVLWICEIEPFRKHLGTASSCLSFQSHSVFPGTRKLFLCLVGGRRRNERELHRRVIAGWDERDRENDRDIEKERESEREERETREKERERERVTVRVLMQLQQQRAKIKALLLQIWGEGETLCCPFIPAFLCCCWIRWNEREARKIRVSCVVCVCVWVCVCSVRKSGDMKRERKRE